MNFTKEILLFCAALGFAFYLHWDTTDLLWSFWTSSFVVGYMTILLTSMKLPIEAIKAFRNPNLQAQQAMNSVKAPPIVQLLVIVLLSSLPGLLFIIPFFTIHFGGFHSVHAMFLNDFAPIEGIIIEGIPVLSNIPFFHKFPDVPRLLSMYWPIVLATAINEFYNVKKQPENTRRKVPKKRKKKSKYDQKHSFQGMMAPYKNVIKIHLLIFALAGLKAANIKGFTLYAVVFTFFFFPFGKLFKKD